MEIDSAAAIHNLHSMNQKQPTPVLIGFDAAIDKIMDVVDKRTGWDSYQRIPNNSCLCRSNKTSGQSSTNLEMVQRPLRPAAVLSTPPMRYSI